MVISPKYIGFLVYLKGPVVTISFALLPGRGFVPNFLKNIPLPALRENPSAIIIIPKYRQGWCNQRPIGANSLSRTITITVNRKKIGGGMRGIEVFMLKDFIKWVRTTINIFCGLKEPSYQPLMNKFTCRIEDIKIGVCEHPNVQLVSLFLNPPKKYFELSRQFPFSCRL